MGIPPEPPEVEGGALGTVAVGAEPPAPIGPVSVGVAGALLSEGGAETLGSPGVVGGTVGVAAGLEVVDG
jgi:hypothetical protein